MEKIIKYIKMIKKKKRYIYVTKFVKENYLKNIL